MPDLDENTSYPGAALPLCSQGIDALPGIDGHFQKDGDYQTSYATDEQLDGLAEVSTVCLNFAGKLADAGYGALSRVTAFSGKSKVVVFALEQQVGQESSVRVFGARMKAAADTDAVVKKINSLIHDAD